MEFRGAPKRTTSSQKTQHGSSWRYVSHETTFALYQSKRQLSIRQSNCLIKFDNRNLIMTFNILSYVKNHFFFSERNEKKIWTWRKNRPKIYRFCTKSTFLSGPTLCLFFSLLATELGVPEPNFSIYLIASKKPIDRYIARLPESWQLSSFWHLVVCHIY